MKLEIQYIKLDKHSVTPKIISDLNVLLPQLSPNAAPLTRERLEHIISSGTQVFAALDDERVIGTALLCSTKILVGQKDWLEDVIVDSSYRGRGIASRLMDIAESTSKEGGAKSINLTSKSDRLGARTLYVKRGYYLRDTGVFRLDF